MGIKSNFPGVAVRVAKIPGIATPENLFWLFKDRRAFFLQPGKDQIDIVLAAGVVGESESFGGAVIIGIGRDIPIHHQVFIWI